MDISVIITSIAAVCLIFLPIIILINIGNYKKWKFKKIINDIAKSLHCKVSDFESWKDSGIGIDDEKHRVFYASNKLGQLYKHHVDLRDISAVKLLGANQSNSDSSKPINKVEISFVYRDSNKPETSIEFYDSSTDYSIINVDIKLAEKWYKIIKDNMIVLKEKAN